jgi:Holliday junction resolvase
VSILVNSFESKIARLYKGKGYYTVISAGSRGVADVVAIKPNEILFIQCKSNCGLSSAEKQKLKQVASSASAKGLFATHRKRRILVQEI